MTAQMKLYVDIGGTDRTNLVYSVPKIPRGLCAVGECDIVLTNKGGVYKSTFSEQQRVAVSAARATFLGFSDYFTGTDAAAPNATKWSVVKHAAATVDIYSNRLRCISGAAGQWAFATSAATYSVPYSLILYVRCTAANNIYDIAVQGKSGGNTYWALYLNAAFNAFAVWTRSAAAFAQRDTGGNYAVNTWYVVHIHVTSTTVNVVINDVYGTLIWDSGAETMDALTTSDVELGNAEAAVTTYYDSLLGWNDTALKGEQLFEGVVDTIELKTEPNTITLHCVDDNVELEREYDDTYGRATTTFTPSYGATDDVSAHVTDLIPSTWTSYCPDSAIHDKLTTSIGTRRILALVGFIDTLPYLGWFTLPMKHLVCVMPDTSPAPDAWTEATASWTAYATGAGAVVSMNLNASAIDGAQRLYVSLTGNGGTAYTFGARRGDALAISMTNYRYITVYYCMPGCGTGTMKLRIWTNIAGSKYWTYTLQDSWGSLPPAVDALVRATVQLPESGNTHGWVATNSPDPADGIQRFEIEGAISSYLVECRVYFDVLYFHANKKLTSKYTLTNILDAQRIPVTDSMNRIILKSATSTYLADDTALQTAYGLRENLLVDLSVSGNEASYGLAKALLAAEQWGADYDTIKVAVQNPGDMYNVMPGDTLTLTASNLNLSTATRTLISRNDSITEKGWITELILGRWAAADPILTVYDKLSRKRY